MEIKPGLIERVNGLFRKYSGILNLLGVVIAIASIIVGTQRIEQALIVQQQNHGEFVNSVADDVINVIQNDISNEIVSEVSTRVENTINAEFNHTYQNIQEAYIMSHPEYQDYNEKAKLGDAYAQLWMAESFRRVGDYVQALYWYENAVEHEGDYQAIAYNNLGWLYTNGYGLSDFGKYDAERYITAYDCFKAASDLGLEIATQNAIEVLRLPNYFSTGERAEEEQLFLEEHNAVIDPNMEKVVVKSAYLHFEKMHGITYTAENYHCTYCGTHVTEMADGDVRTVYDYYGVVYNTDGQVERCKLAPITGL